MQKKRVLVEMRVPEALPDEKVLAFVSKQIRLDAFELDTRYEPVPSAPLEEIADELATAGERLLTLRGTVPLASQPELETQPGVVAVWSDAEVEPFDDP